jgi:uncharacterized protein (DUF2267 family)
VRGALLATSTIMLVRIEELASHVAAHAGVSDPVAEYALRAVVTGLGGYLKARARQLIGEELPAPLVTALGSAVADRRGLDERVQITGLSPGQIHELVASVCRVLAEELSEEALRAVTAALPPATAALFVPSSPAVSRTMRRRPQSGSVREPNPHGDTKLSSAPGTTQEREHETLAEGRPGPRHRLSDPN